MKKFKIILTGLIFSLLATNIFASSIDNIETIDNKTIIVTASPDVTFSDIKVYGDVKVLRDLNIIDSVKSNTNKREIILSLGNDLNLNSSYSIIGVGGAEGSIEFALGDTFSLEFENQNYLNEEKIIEKVVVSDARTIELFYNYDIVNSNYDFKVLNELVTEDMYSSGNNVLEIKLNTPLEKLASYILMISSLQDIYGRELVFDEILYDFFTDDSLLDQNIITEEPVSQNVDEEIEFVGNIDENEDNLEEIALNAATVPDTGAESWIILIFAVLLTTFLFIRTVKS